MKGRFHFFYAVRYLRYGFLLCLIPLVRALVAFQLEAFFTALQQDVLILVVMAFLSVYTWLAARYSLQGEFLEISIGFLTQRTFRYRPQDFAACELRRTLFQRLFGAAELELYLTSRFSRKSHTLLLPYKQAVALREALFPVPDTEVQYRPSGGEWLMLVALSTNLITETALVVYTISKVQNFLGTDFSHIALSRLERFAMAAGAALPAGVSLLLSLFFLFTLCSLAISALRTGGYQVGRAGQLLLCRGGLYTRVEQRVRLGCVSSIDVRCTLLSRITGYNAVYLYAGGFSNRNTPVLFFRKQNPGLALQLLPGLALPRPLKRFRYRSVWQYLWVHGSVLAVWVVFWVVAGRLVPAVAPMMGLLCGLWLGLCLIQAEAFFTEGYEPVDDTRAYFAFGRMLTRHYVTVFLPRCSYKVAYTSLSIQENRATLMVYTPGGRKLVARGINKSEADRWVHRCLSRRALRSPFPESERLFEDGTQ